MYVSIKTRVSARRRSITSYRRIFLFLLKKRWFMYVSVRRYFVSGIRFRYVVPTYVFSLFYTSQFVYKRRKDTSLMCYILHVATTSFLRVLVTSIRLQKTYFRRLPTYLCALGIVIFYGVEFKFTCPST